MRTAAVPRRTTLLLVRYRFHLELPGRDGPRQLVAEDAQVLAYRGQPASAEWLSQPRCRRCWPPRRPATSRPTRPWTSPNAPSPPWPPSTRTWTVADELAVKLRDDHIRVREAGGQRVRRQIAVRAQKPADILGVYVYLPGGEAA